MEEFLNKLYNYEYFGTYLMISIAVLVLIFIIILIFGKKDQKHREIEETKKLQQINENTLNGFKETGEGIPLTVEPNLSAPVNTPVAEAPVSPIPNLENDTIIVPTLDINASLNNVAPATSVNQMNNEIPNVEPIINTPENTIVNPVNPVNEVNNLNAAINRIDNPNLYTASQNVMPSPMPNVETPKVEEMPRMDIPEMAEMPRVGREEAQPILAKEEEQPFNFGTSFVKSEDEVASPSLANVPEFNFDTIVNNVSEPKRVEIPKQREVFSSVYTNEAPKEAPIEMPSVKEEEEDIELPTLKKDVEEAKLNDYNLNDLTGEFYTINK